MTPAIPRRPRDRRSERQCPIECPIAVATEPLREMENPATVRDFAVARPGLEPGTPRFSDSCTQLSNARESPATTRLRATRGLNREVRKLHEIAGNDGHEVPLVSESPGCGQMPAAARGGASADRDSRRHHCSRSSRLEPRSCSSSQAVVSSAGTGRVLAHDSGSAGYVRELSFSACQSVSAARCAI
jgi:hypothetical protein